jgi:glycosyltransferase involved in cell wall biosynthesis
VTRRRVAHLISGLYTGGAEMMLYKLLSGTRHESLVISMTGSGTVGEPIRQLGVPVHLLEMPRGRLTPGGLWRLRALLRRFRPDVLQTWLYHADLVGGAVARAAGGIPVVWNIRQSMLDLESSKRGTIWTFRAAARLSHWLPERIVCCSEVGERQHVQHGYAADRFVLIPNGFDLSAFQPSEAARDSLRAELGVPQQSRLVGLVARFDPQKDHRGFVSAAGRLRRAREDVHFVLCGEGAAPDNGQLTAWIEATGFPQHFHLLGRRSDMPRITAALDVATSASYQEGFPNVIGEAMACAVPCVVTDAGDSAAIVGDAGIVVPPRDPDALVAGWGRVLSLSPEEWRRHGDRARERVRRHFSLDSIVRQYDELYSTLAA